MMRNQPSEESGEEVCRWREGKVSAVAIAAGASLARAERSSGAAGPRDGSRLPPRLPNPPSSPPSCRLLLPFVLTCSRVTPQLSPCSSAPHVGPTFSELTPSSLASEP
ncbi:unnamed protein product [Rangifer tarandus platyrhynchus]|uniref:Uncharacterized protein n=2 Tax=Rangifer tarandus platyrhynchus TaxID=3082113 RepID=A0AC59YAQ8_RANTA|nr:unnamed protein product [Rangifer tarandus platyrhynchus]